MKLIKQKVCVDCHGQDPNCTCTYYNGYDTIELEFHTCKCCGRPYESPANTEFNSKQLKTLSDESDETAT